MPTLGQLVLIFITAVTDSVFYMQIYGRLGTSGAASLRINPEMKMILIPKLRVGLDTL